MATDPVASLRASADAQWAEIKRVAFRGAGAHAAADEAHIRHFRERDRHLRHKRANQLVPQVAPTTPSPTGPLPAQAPRNL